MKIIIAGSRDVTKYSDVFQAVYESSWIDKITEVVSGRARGVDKLGEEFAKDREIPVALFPADWNTYGKRAGYLRNEDMAHYADALIAVWDGKSKGTRHMIDFMKMLNKPVYIYYTED